MIVLSHIQVTPLLKARIDGATAFQMSLDLELSESEVSLEPEGVRFPDGQSLTWATLEEIGGNETVGFLVEESAAHRIQFFSEAMNRLYSLLPTQRAPTMLVAGFPMHRIKDIDPHEDTLRKIRTIAPVTGRVLDTTTGLGYTAIEAAKTADSILTVEIDPTALEVARRNPWSQALFSNPKIRQRIGSSFDVVPTLPDEEFARIYHDPPTFKLAGDLYSREFYEQLHRVLKRGGRLFHYIGDLNSALGNTVGKGAVRRLQEAGFAKVVRKPEAFGLVAYK